MPRPQQTRTGRERRLVLDCPRPGDSALRGPRTLKQHVVIPWSPFTHPSTLSLGSTCPHATHTHTHIYLSCHTKPLLHCSGPPAGGHLLGIAVMPPPAPDPLSAKSTLPSAAPANSLPLTPSPRPSSLRSPPPYLYISRSPSLLCSPPATERDDPFPTILSASWGNTTPLPSPSATGLVLGQRVPGQGHKSCSRRSSREQPALRG